MINDFVLLRLRARAIEVIFIIIVIIAIIAIIIRIIIIIIIIKSASYIPCLAATSIHFTDIYRQYVACVFFNLPHVGL